MDSNSLELDEVKACLKESIVLLCSCEQLLCFYKRVLLGAWTKDNEMLLIRMQEMASWCSSELGVEYE